MSPAVAVFVVFVMTWLTGLVAWLVKRWPRELLREKRELERLIAQYKAHLALALDELVIAKQENAELRLSGSGAAPREGKRGRILAAFPDLPGQEPLSFDEEKRILREAGGDWQLVILEGFEATRGGIARELHVGHGARLLYLASHGGNGQIALSGGETANRTWLPSLVRFYGIEAVVLNACDSDDLADSLIAAGATMVLTASDKINDRQAGKVAVAFLQALAWGEKAARAVEYARMSCDDVTGAMLRLRGDETWSWAA